MFIIRPQNTYFSLSSQGTTFQLRPEFSHHEKKTGSDRNRHLKPACLLPWFLYVPSGEPISLA